MIDQERIRIAEQILLDNGVEDPQIVLQAIGYALLDIELYEEQGELK